MAVAERVLSEGTRELEKYRGQWVALKDSRVVAAGATPAEVLQELEAKGITGAALDHVPDDPRTVYIL
jgi:hypothetical protein